MVQLLIHNQKDTVGVAVVEIKAGTVAKGLYMDSQNVIEIKASMDIPLCHKIAIRDMKSGDTAYKFGHDIGRIVADVRAGELVHIHNIKTKRW